MYQEAVSEAEFFSVKAKMVLPFLIASARSGAEEEREAEMASKAAEEGKASVRC
jgi:hypothetical protein